MLNTFHRNCVSRKNTIAADKTSTIPVQKQIKHANEKGRSRMAGVRAVLVLDVNTEKSKFKIYESKPFKKKGIG